MGGKTRLIHALLRSHNEVLADREENKVFQILTALVSCKPQPQLNGYHKTCLSPPFSLLQRLTFQEKKLFIVELIVQAGMIYLNICQ